VSFTLPPPATPPDRLLLGPGPSSVSPRVLRALATPMLGYLDPAFLRLLDETQGLLRHVYETENPLTLALTGTGMAGMEAVLANLLEPGDRLLVAAAGFFGERIAEVARRHGAEVTKIERPWGEVFPLEQVAEALGRERVKALALVHAETSTGALQPLDGLADLARKNDALLVVDCVTSLGGVSVGLDANGIDAAYSGTQKCLGCPPGLAPVSLSEHARAAIRGRSRPVSAWYFDLELLARYWGGERAYHHTPSPSLLYALHEALRMIAEEGLPARWARHRANAEALWSGLTALGLELLVPASHRLPTLTTVRVPEGTDEAAVRARLRDDHGIEIGAGLGPLKGKVWRIGLMGHSSQRGNVALLLSALREVLSR
jgi:alanine-glyoxylate transaminase / serine-glyoxylate transaminase / serine-pyruvate transaminase